MSLFSDPTFWVAVSFILFLGVLYYYKVQQILSKMLDERSENIKNELEEARRLREEAQTILAEYERKQRDAVKEAGEIIEQSKHESKLQADEMKTKINETMKRREKMVEDKIIQAKERAITEVRQVAIDVAVKVVEEILEEDIKGDKAITLIDKSIAEINKRLN